MISDERLAAGPAVGLDDALFYAVEVPLARAGDERVLLGLLDLLLLFAVLAGPLLYRLGLGLHGLLGELQGLHHHGLGDLVRPSLDHGDGLLRSRDHEVEVALGDLVVGRVQDELAIKRPPHAHGPDGTIEGQIRERERRGGPDHAYGVVRRILVSDEDGAYDLYLVVVVLGEEWP